MEINPQISPEDARKALRFMAERDSSEREAGDVVDSRSAGRYERKELRDKGGFGRVWEAHDSQLSRPVALKEMRPDKEWTPSMRARFLVEARITGQLEHPGIVPVYELIEDAREGPYYTMRLVRGRTLSRAIHEFHENRQAEQPDSVVLQTLLQAFVSVCNPLAYAHSRGVVHRDLKPANVVLGPFGEVVVLDWGQAKVLGTADEGQDAVLPLAEGELEPTQQGQAGGTPNYMAPEQALGQVERIDRRTDVFGLGGILCAILTGKAPYLGGSVEEVLRKARQGDLGEAYARLDGCKVDAALVALAKDCLCAEMAGRPRDAGMVAGRVTAYLAAVQQRLQDAVVERAAAQARAEEAVKKAAADRRARRWQVRSLLLVIAVMAIGCWVLYEWTTTARRQQREEERLEQDVSAHLAVVFAHLATDDIPGAEAVLQRAEGRLAKGGSESLRLRTQQARIGLQLAERLEQIRVEALGGPEDGDAPHVKGQRIEFSLVVRRKTDLAFHEALRDYRISPKADPASAAATVRDAPIRLQLIRAVDFWAYILAGGDLEGAKALLKVAALADPDPWRVKVRERLFKMNKAELSRMANSPEALAATPETALLVYTAFVLRGELSTALQFLVGAQRRHPDNLWLNHSLGIHNWYHRRNLTGRQEALQYLRIALALRKDNPALRALVGSVLTDLRDYDSALAETSLAIERDQTLAAAYLIRSRAWAAKYDWERAKQDVQRAIQLQKDFAAAHANLGQILAQLGRLDDALAASSRAIEIGPDMALGYLSRGGVLMMKSRAKEAESDYQRAVKLDPAFARAEAALGFVTAVLGRRAEGERLCARALGNDPDNPDVHVLQAAVYVTGKDLVLAAKSLEQAIRLDPNLLAAHAALGTIRLEQRKMEAAKKIHVRMRQLAPNAYQTRLAELAIAFQEHETANPKILLPLTERAVADFPEFGMIRCLRADALSMNGRKREAELEARKAIKLSSPPAWENNFAHWILISILDAAHRHAEVIGLMQEYLRSAPPPRPTDASAALEMIGDAYLRLGTPSDALPYLPTARNWPSDPAEQKQRRQNLVRLCEILLDLKAHAAEVDAGTYRPAVDPGFAVELAGLCRSMYDYPLAIVRLCEVSFAKGSLNAGQFLVRRELAARAAARAGCGKGWDAPTGDRDRRRLRRLAFDWLEECRSKIERSQAEGTTSAEFGRSVIEKWQKSPEFAGVRDSDHLSRLDARERDDWERFWNAVKKMGKRKP
jgi:serine/threonine-protein kinase